MSAQTQFNATDFPPLSSSSSTSKPQQSSTWITTPKHTKKPTQKSTNSAPLIWLDCEMTGLNTHTEHIIEIAIIVTNWRLEELHVMEPLVINVPEEVLERMDEWNTTHHGDSGLTQQVRQSKLTHADAEEQILRFLQEECKLEKSTCCLAGNSVHADKEFLKKDMPRIVDFLHYRILDVSSFKICAQQFNPDLLTKAPRKKLAHRALDDIRESIEEMRFYKKHFLRCSERT